MRSVAIERTRCRFRRISSRGPQSRKMKETSSRGRTVSPCKRLSLIAGTTGPVKQPAKYCGVNGEFGADVPLDRRQDPDGRRSSWAPTIRLRCKRWTYESARLNDLTAPKWPPSVGGNQGIHQLKTRRPVEHPTNNLRLQYKRPSTLRISLLGSSASSPSQNDTFGKQRPQSLTPCLP